MAVNKKILAKKDMNFFEEFTANAAKMKRLLGYAIIVGVIVVGLLIAWVVYGFVRNLIIKSEIEELTALLDSDEYRDLEAQAEALAAELQEKQVYYYALSQMRMQVDTTPAAPDELPDTLAKCIPSDTYIEDYEITSTTMALTGYSFSYYSVVDMLNMLNDSDVYTSIGTSTIERVDPSVLGSSEDFYSNGTANAINNYYAFEIEGTLLGEVYVTIGRFATEGETVTSLSGLETQAVTVGDTFTVEEGVLTYQTGGITYNLASVTLNGTAADADTMATITSTGTISAVANDNIEIDLYYTSEAAAEGTTEEEAEG